MAKASSIPAEFAKLNDEGKAKFTKATLDTLIKIASNPKTRVKFFKKYLAPKKKGRPKDLTQEEIDTIQQVVTVFLYSLKEEFRYWWSKLVCLFLPPQLVPKGLWERIEERLEEVETRRFVHLSFDPESYSELQKIVNNLGGWDAFFNHALEKLGDEKGGV